MSNISEVLGLDEYSSDEDLANVELFKDYDESLLTFATVSCVIFMMIGIPGNFITILALARYKKVWNATAIFIMILSLSDLLFCCFNLPLAATTFAHKSWVHGKFLCRMFPMTQYGLVAVSLFTVMSITISRCIMISRPVLYTKMYTKPNITLMILLIWLIPFGTLLPTYFEHLGRFSLHPTTGSCTIVHDADGGSPKRMLFIVAFGIPTLVIIIGYARILWIVRKTAKLSRPQKIKITRLNIEPTIIEVPETSTASGIEVPKKREAGKQCSLPCFYPELSSSCNDSASNDAKFECAPEFRGAPSLSSERAKKIRQSFVTTFRRSTALIKPRLPTKKDKRLLTLIIAIITTFLICHLPITLTKTIFDELSSHPGANIAGYVLIYSTTSINPIIYVVLSVEFRKAYKNLFSCR